MTSEEKAQILEAAARILREYVEEQTTKCERCARAVADDDPRPGQPGYVNHKPRCY